MFNIRKVMLYIRKWLGLDYYTSELDLFLEAFDKAHPKLTAAQRQEVEKYARIFQLRDCPLHLKPNTTLWDQF